MKRFLVLATLAVACTAVQAQNSMTRLEKQHGPSRYQETVLPNAEATLLLSLDSTWQGEKRSVIQTARYLEQLFPSYPFTSWIKPLGRILQDEKADPIERKLAALALDNLHSAESDAIIKAVSLSTEDKGLQSLLVTLQSTSGNWKVLGPKK